MPPAIRSPINAAVIWPMVRLGAISAAVNVALSRIADLLSTFYLPMVRLGAISAAVNVALSR